MVTAGNDFKCRVLDPHNQDLLATLKGHKGPVLDVDISADCRCAVSASADKTLRVWNCDTYECLQHCIGHFGPVLSCSFGGTGKNRKSHKYFYSSVVFYNLPRGVSYFHAGFSRSLIVAIDCLTLDRFFSTCCICQLFK